MNRRSQAAKEGSVMVIALLALMLLGIIVPAYVQLIKKESHDANQDSKRGIDFHLAEAGQDRGAWKLRESDAIWQQAVAGTAISGYQGDTVYNDIPGGEYKITFSAGPGPGEVTVISKGRATGETGVRAIQAVYTKSAIAGAMNVAGGIQYRPNLIVHWGPVVTYTSIDQTPSQYYPRKYSAGQIVGRDTVNDLANGAMPSGDWATYDYAAFYELGNAPTVDLDSYRTVAKQSCVPELRRTSGSSAAAHTMNGTCDSGYYTESVKIDSPGGGGGSYSFTCSTCVIFVEGNVAQFPNSAWLDVRGLLATGDVDFNARSHNYTATIPASASKEYQHSSLSGYFAGRGWTDGGTTAISNAGMHGFLYAGGNVSNAGGGSILVGSLYVGGTVSVNTLTIYYDQAVADDVLLQNAQITRSSWDEIATSW